MIKNHLNNTSKYWLITKAQERIGGRTEVATKYFDILSQMKWFKDGEKRNDNECERYGKAEIIATGERFNNSYIKKQMIIK